MDGEPVAEIARYFQVTRQWIYQIIGRYKESQEYLVLKQLGRRPQFNDMDSEELILESCHGNNLSSIHLEKKIEEIHGTHIPYNRIEKVGSIDKIARWQIFIKPHISLGYNDPANVFSY